MGTVVIAPRNFVVTGTSSFRIDFDISVGNDRVRSIACGGAIDDLNYLMQYDPTGEVREFTFDFSGLKKNILSTSTINILVRIRDADGNVGEWGFCRQYGVESGMRLVSNPRIDRRADGSGLVDVRYDYHSPLEIDPATVSVAISSDGGETWTVPTTSMAGDVGSGVPVGPNRMATWDPAVDFPEGGTITADVCVSGAIGQSRTGTLVINPADTKAPTVRLTGETKPRYGVQAGNVYKNNSFAFIPYESSSESSESSSSSLSSVSSQSSRSSVSSSSRSSLSSSTLSSISSQSSSSISSESSSSSSASSQSSASSRSSRSSLSSLSSESSPSSESSLSESSPSESSLSSMSSASSISSQSSSTQVLTSSSSSADVYYIASGFGSAFINGDFAWTGTYYNGRKVFMKRAPSGWPLASLEYTGANWKILYCASEGPPCSNYYHNDNSEPDAGTWTTDSGTAPAGTITKAGI